MVDAVTVTIYVATDGDDARSGFLSDAPIRTLGRAQQVVRSMVDEELAQDAEIRIAPGTYLQTSTLEWTTYIPGQNITFAPLGYTLGTGGWSQRPKFAGQGVDGWWLWAQPGPHAGRLQFHYLDVTLYSKGGIRFDGGTKIDPVTGLLVGDGPGNNENYVFGCQFRYMGSKWGVGQGYGAINTVNSSDNIFANSHFLDLENLGGTYNGIHGWYAGHQSSRNQLIDSRFVNISGDPIRTRNASSKNRILRNDFINTGSRAYYSEWLRDVDYKLANPDSWLEQVSEDNWFKNNRLLGPYNGADTEMFELPVPPGYTGLVNGYTGVLPGRTPGLMRLYTAGNRTT